MAFLRRFREHTHRSEPHGRAAEPIGIVEDLTRLFGSQRDYSSFLPDFGLGELWHRPITPRSIELLRKEILALVLAYEPRIATPEVLTLPRVSDGTLPFLLRGRMASGAPLTLRIELSPQQNRILLMQGDAA